jgi:hypothetical protein
LREFLGQVAKDVQASIRIGSVTGKEHRSDQAAVVLSVLRPRRTVKVDHDLQAYFSSPVHSLDEVGILAGDIRLVVPEINCPVAQRYANCVEACCLHDLEIFAVDESTVTSVSGVL